MNYSDIINIIDISISLDINIINTIYSLINYYLSNLIVFLVSISSITNRDAYKRYSYTSTTNDFLYIIRLKFSISDTIYTENR